MRLQNKLSVVHLVLLVKLLASNLLQIRFLFVLSRVTLFRTKLLLVKLPQQLQLWSTTLMPNKVSLDSPLSLAV